MNREQAKQFINENPQMYFKKARVSGYVCPICGSGSGKDGSGITKDPKSRNHFRCWKCGTYGDVIEFISKEYALDPAEAFKKAYEIYNIQIDNQQAPGGHTRPAEQRKAVNDTNTHAEAKESLKEDYNPFYLQAKQKLLQNTTAMKYLTDRGITSPTIKKFNLGYAGSWTHPKVKKHPSDRIIIPAGKHSYTARAIDKNTPANYKAQKVGETELFNLESIEASDVIFIVEGEFDGLSIEEAGESWTALRSTSNINKLLKALKNMDMSGKVLVLSLDNDNAGREATEKLQKGLSEAGILHIAYNISGEYNDPNDMLVADRELFEIYIQTAKAKALEVIREAEEEAEAEREQIKAEYMKNSTAFHLQEFVNGIGKNTDTPHIPTGFKALDTALDGGLYSGLYIIGAISSLGKTTFVLQIADQVAQQGHDVLIFSLEMARTELMSKSISRLTFNLCEEVSHAKTARGITASQRWAYYSDQEEQLIYSAMQNYAEYAGNIYIHEGIGDIGVEQIKETVERHISITGKTPLVVIDYLQILAPYDMRASDKQNTDKAVMELKRLSRDKKLTVFGISSLNRQSYNAPINMTAFKESGSIEYSSDVLLGLQLKGTDGDNFDVDEAKAKDPREIELKVLKNRNGATGNKIAYEFYSKFNYFREGGEYVRPISIEESKKRNRK